MNCRWKKARWLRNQRLKNKTNIHEPYFRPIAYGRDTHKQGKYERQCAEAECQ